MTLITEKWGCPDAGSLTCDHTWTEHPTADWWHLRNNRAENLHPQGSNGFASARADTDLATDDHKCFADVTWTFGDDDATAGTCVRYSASAETYYVGGWRQDKDFDRIYKVVDGASSKIAQQTHVLSAPDTFRIDTEADGSTISVVVADGDTLSLTDTSITGNTRCGIAAEVLYGIDPGVYAFNDWTAHDLSTVIVGQATETVTAQPISVTGGTYNVGQARETVTAQPVDPIVPTVYDFETGDTSQWDTVNNLSAVTTRVHSGTYAGYSQSDSTSGNVLASVVPDGMAGGNRISKFEVYWQETSNSNGSGVQLVNSEGNTEVGVATDNPQWEIDDFYDHLEVYGGDGVDRWVRYTLTFDWANQEYDYDFEDQTSGTRRQGTRKLKQGVDVETVRLDVYVNGAWSEQLRSVETWWDDITVHAAGTSSGKSVTVGQVTETTVAQSVSATLGGGQTISVGTVSETTTAQPISASKVQSVGTVTETTVAQPVSAERTVSVGQASEATAAQPIGSAKTQTVGQITETTVAQPIGATKTVAVGQVTETTTAQPVSASTATTVSVGTVTETTVAQPVGSSKARAVGQATETSTAQPVSAERSVTVGTASETTTAQPVSATKTVNAGTVTETTAAQSISATLAGATTVTVGTATETTTAQPISASKAQSVGTVSETTVAQPIGALKTVTVGQVAETATAQAISSLKTLAVGQATETTAAQSIGVTLGEAQGMAITAQGAHIPELTAAGKHISALTAEGKHVSELTASGSG